MSETTSIGNGVSGKFKVDYNNIENRIPILITAIFTSKDPPSTPINT